MYIQFLPSGLKIVLNGKKTYTNNMIHIKKGRYLGSIIIKSSANFPIDSIYIQYSTNNTKNMELNIVSLLNI